MTHLSWNRRSGRKARYRARTVLLLAILTCIMVQSSLPVPDHGGGTTVQADALPGSRDATFQFVGGYPPTEYYSEGYLGLFPLLVQNIGSSNGNGTARVSGLPDGWLWELVEGNSILSSVPSEDVIRITIQVMAGSPLPGRYNFMVNVDPGTGPMLLEATVPFMANMTLESTPAVIGDASKGADVDVKVTNNGNGPDSFELSAMMPTADWDHEISPEGRSPLLEVGGSHNWTVHLTVPAGTEASLETQYGYQALFMATSSGDEGTTALALTTVRVAQHHGLHLSVEEGTVMFDPSKSFAMVTLIVENGGNGPERVALSVDLPEGWSVQYPDKVVEMWAFERTYVPIYLAPTTHVVAGTYRTTVTATLENVTEVPPVSTTITMIVPEEHGLFMPVNGIGGVPSTVPGGKADIGFVVNNRGNHLDLVEMVPLDAPLGWKVELTPSTLSLPSGHKADVRAAITVSDEPMEAIEGRHQVLVMARSLYTGEVSILALNVDIEGVAGLAIWAEDDLKEVNPFLDPVPVFIFKLRNTGNAQVVAGIESLTPFGKEGWVQPSQGSVQLSPGDIARIFMTVEPGPEGAGYHQFAVRSVTGDAGGASATALYGLVLLERDIDLTGLEVREPGRRSWGPSAEVAEGESIEVRATIENVGSDRTLDEARTFDVELLVDGRVQATRRSFGPDFPVCVLFTLKLDEGGHEITVRTKAQGELDLGNNERSAKVHVSQAPGQVPAGAAATGLALGTGTLLMGAILTNESWKFKVVLLIVVPLYTRIRKEATLDNFTRGRIYGYIEANPGDHYNAIKKALSLPNGSLAYHLDILLREGFVKYELDGSYKRFYPRHMTIRKDGKESLRPGYMTRIQGIIVEKVKDEPGISQRQIARALNLSPSTINYHVRTLAMAGILRLERGISRTRCFLEKEPEPEPAETEA